MKSVVAIACLLVAISGSGEALRMRGEPYEGQRYVNLKPIAQPADRKGNFIVGGEIAKDASSPWQVSIQNLYGNHFCGGAIIADQYVLTAASCVAGLKAKSIKVVTSTNDWMGLAWEYGVEDIIVHCNFDKPLYHNDVALLKTKTLFLYDDRTQNITLAEEDELVEGEILTMTGWGSWVVGEYYPNALKKLDLKYLPYEKCRSMYGNSDDVDLGHICGLAKNGEGACHGDTGGPLLNAKGQLVGVSNFGVPCGHGFPDVFAKVAYFHDWIRTSMKGCKNI